MKKRENDMEGNERENERNKKRESERGKEKYDRKNKVGQEEVKSVRINKDTSGVEKQQRKKRG